jgi:hypothetical protein
MAIVRKKRRKGQRRKAPRTVEQFNALPARSQDALTRAAHVITSVRAGSSLKSAARKFEVDPRTVRRLAGAALRRTPSGHYVANKRDRVLRMMVLPTPGGLAEVALNDSRQATLVAEYWNAVHLFLATGDGSALVRYEGAFVTTAQGARIQLLTDLDELERLGSAGVLSFESLYARVG